MHRCRCKHLMHIHTSQHLPHASSACVDCCLLLIMVCVLLMGTPEACQPWYLLLTPLHLQQCRKRHISISVVSDSENNTALDVAESSSISATARPHTPIGRCTVTPDIHRYIAHAPHPPLCAVSARRGGRLHSRGRTAAPCPAWGALTAGPGAQSASNHPGGAGRQGGCSAML